MILFWLLPGHHGSTQIFITIIILLLLLIPVNASFEAKHSRGHAIQHSIYSFCLRIAVPDFIL